MDFDSPGKFAEFLSMVVVPNVATALEEGLHEVGEHVVQEAKSKFGHYQKQVYKFPAWAELSSRTKSNRMSEGFPENEPLLRTGNTRDSIDYQVSGGDVVVGSSEPTMVYHELGTKTEPPRPVLGPAMYQARNMIRGIMGKATVLAIVPGMKITKVSGFKRTGPRLTSPVWDSYKSGGR